MMVLFGLGICLFEGYITYSFLNNFLKLRIDKRWLSISIMSTAMIILFLVNQFHISKLNLVASVILSITACQILFVDSGKKKLVYIVLSNFIILCCEFVMMMVYRLPLGNNAIQYNENSLQMVLVVLSTKLLTLLIIRLWCYLANNSRTIFFPSLLPYFCLFPISCLFLYIGITYSSISFRESSPSDILIVFGCVLLLLSNIILFLAYDKMSFMMKCVKEYEVVDIKRNLENQHYHQIEEINKKHSGVIHDMTNYLNTIKILAEKDSNGEIVGLINSFNNHIVRIQKETYCNNQILNAILNGKKQEAHTKHVKYQVYVEPGFEKPEIEDIDLISIMSNLEDNAIDAACKCEDGVVDIQLYKANDGRFTIIKILNNYDEEPVEKAGELVTQKGNTSMHGIGLRQVKMIVEKYGGWWDIEYGNSQFCITIMFAK